MSKPKRIVGALGVALVVAIGFALVYAVAVAWGGSCWEAFVCRQRGFNENLIVTADGTPLIERITYNEYYQTNKAEYRTLRSKEVPFAEKEGRLADASLPIPRYSKELFPIVGQQRIGRFSDAKNDPWYFVGDGARDGHGYFVGYSRENKRCLGFIGRSGFRADQPPVDDRFPIDGVKLQDNAAFATRGRYYFSYDYNDEDNSYIQAFPKWKVEMISSAQLLEIDLRDRSVKTLMESPNLDAVAILWAPGPDNSPKNARNDARPKAYFHDYLAVRTADRVVLFDGLGKQHSTYAVPEELRDRGFSFYEIGKDAALLTYGSARGKSPDANVEKLVWIDAAGNILQREDAELYEGQRRDEHSEAWKATVVVPSPIVLAFVAAVMLPLEDMETGKQGFFARAAHHLAVYALPLLLVSLISAVLAFLCWRRNRRYYQLASGLWLVFVLLTGLPGLVGYLFHRRWPVREACPSCGRIVPRDRDACAACGKEFPAPKLKGIEVFA